jgi:hypothetical protein
MNTSGDDRQAFRILAELYAQAADHHRPELMDAVMAEDAVLEGPGFRLAGRAAIRAIPDMVRQRYRVTRHVVENQVVTVDGGQAKGETYCTASHLYDDPAAGPQVLVWHIRYQDRFVRTDSGWRFAERRLVIDWTETRSVTIPAK